MKNIKSIEKEIKNLEELLLKPDIRKSVSDLSKILAEDFIEFGSSGMIFTKKEIIKSLQEESNPQLSLTNFKLKDLGRDYFLATYKSLREEDGEKFYSLRSSIWLKKNERYVMIFHQGTKIKK
ncbi:MAG: DUF4440 domain-containing protein [Ignavibacteriaceae bacterium]